MKQAQGVFNTPTGLPIIKINGEKFYLDNRLEECRDVCNPHRRITFDQINSDPDQFQISDEDYALSYEVAI